MPQSNINSRPTEEVLQTLQALCADEHNSVYIISGRRKSELGAWFASVVRAPLTPLLQAPCDPAEGISCILSWHSARL